MKEDRGRIYSRVLRQQVKNRVRNYLFKEGYYDARVRTIEREDTLLDGGIKLVIGVSRGRKVRVNRFGIFGQRTFSSAKLKSKFTGLGEPLRFTFIQALISEMIYAVIHL